MTLLQYAPESGDSHLSGGLFRQGVSVSEKYALIDAEKKTLDPDGRPRYTVATMCQWLDVSTSGYYEWRTRPQSATARRREHLKGLVEKVFADSDQTYGYRRVHAQLLRQGERCTPEFGELDLVPCQPRPWRFSLTEADAHAAPIPDLVARDFTANTPGTKMVGDITYIPTWEGWVYLSVLWNPNTRVV